jgi:hypothetical protein
MESAIMYLSSHKQQYHVLRNLLFVFICSALIFTAGCATVGHEFPVSQVKKIQIDQTTKEEILAMFGEPWRVGLESGQETWSYGKYHYTMFSEKDAKDLVVRFTDDNVVESYTFNITNR